MTTHPDPYQADPPQAVPPDALGALASSPMLAEVQALTNRTYSATSTDGHATVVVGGDQRLREVTIHTADAPAGLISRSVTNAANEALTTARRTTVAAMRDLPTMPDELQQLLGGQE